MGLHQTSAQLAQSPRNSPSRAVCEYGLRSLVGFLWCGSSRTSVHGQGLCARLMGGRHAVGKGGTSVKANRQQQYCYCPLGQ